MEIKNNDMEKLYAETFQTMEEGTILSGKILAIKPDGVIVDIGYKGSGTINIDEFNNPDGTVGVAVKDTTVKIGEGGELLIKGPQVMMGYYKNEAATKEVFTDDGFFRTGDIAEIDSDGYVKITGRIKDLIITSGGKNISPQNIENSLLSSRYIEQVAVIGVPEPAGRDESARQAHGEHRGHDGGDLAGGGLRGDFGRKPLDDPDQGDHYDENQDAPQPGDNDFKISHLINCLSSAGTLAASRSVKSMAL